MDNEHYDNTLADCKIMYCWLRVFVFSTGSGYRIPDETTSKWAKEQNRTVSQSRVSTVIVSLIVVILAKTTSRCVLLAIMKIKDVSCRDHEDLGILAWNYHPKTSLIFTFWHFVSIG